MTKIKIEDLKGKNYKEVEGLEIYKTCPIVLQKAMIDNVVNNIVKKDEHGIYSYDVVDKEVLKCVACASLYTNIELSENDYYNYDILNETGIVNQLCYNYDFYCLFDSAVENKMGENSIEHTIAKSAKDMIDILENIGEHVNTMLDKGDPNKIAKYLSKGFEMLASKMPNLSEIKSIEDLKNKVN